MTVEDKAPLLATLIEADTARAYASQALARARIWDADRLDATNRPNPAAALTAHVKASQQKGVVPSRPPPGDHRRQAPRRRSPADYKANLY